MTKSFVYFFPEDDKKTAKERAEKVLKPISKYNEKAEKVLELGVGLGAVLDNFPKKYDIYGLDIEKEYVDICEKRVRRGKFFVSSMHNFRIKEKFDVIFSVFDSINFLENFGQLKSTFNAVSQHLNEGGLFIFDMYTPRTLRHFKGRKATASKFAKGYLLEGAVVKGNTLTWDFKIFERVGQDMYQIHEYEWTEKIYPVPKVESPLSKMFQILESKRWEEGRRILFVCRKKA